MRFTLALHSENVSNLLSNSSHWLRGMIQLKWSLAENDVFQILEQLSERRPTDNANIKPSLQHDMAHMRKKSKDPQSVVYNYKDEVSQTWEAYRNVKKDRDTLTHGNIETPNMSGGLDIPDASISVSSPMEPMYKPGKAAMINGRHRVSLDPISLRMVNEKMDRLLRAVRSMWTAVDPTFVFEVKLEISNASDPSIGWDQYGTKKKTVRNTFKLSQIMNQDPISHYRCSSCGTICRSKSGDDSVTCHSCGIRMTELKWRECPECDVADIEGGSACWHMMTLRHFENGEGMHLNFVIPIDSIRRAIEAPDQVSGGNLQVTVDLNNGKVGVYRRY